MKMALAPRRRRMAPLIKAVIAIMIASTLAAGLQPPKPAHAFTIGITDVLNPFQTYMSLDEEQRHEIISVTGLEAATTQVTQNWTPSLNFETDLVRGVQNTDIEHQWDCDSHFDNSTVRLPVPAASQDILCSDGKGNFGFDAGFATLRTRLQIALDNAKGNPEFLNPDFIRFSDIVVEIQNTLLSMQNDPACDDALACPQARLIPVQLELLAYMVVLGYNPNPDPFPADGGDSPFQYSPYPAIVQATINDLNELLGPHSEPSVIGCGCDKTLAEAIGSEHPLVKQLQRELNEVKAYIAFEALGHVFHTTEDFFAHSNYVELMAAGASGQTIITHTSDQSIATATASAALPSGWPVCDPGSPAACANDAYPAVPASYDDFTLAGIQSLLSANGADASSLQTGAVVTRWLGEGNYCGSSFDHLFNPVIGTTIPGFSVGPISVAGVSLGFNFPAITVGTSPVTDSPPGFDYCHYQTPTTMGLNKDEPGSGEAQQVNHAYAFSAAVRMAMALWRNFFGQLTPATTVTSNPTPVDGEITTHQTVLSLNAVDSTGGSVASISYTASGANPVASTTVAGSSAQVTISNPGDTYIQYFATSTNGIQEPVKEYVVRLRTTAANPGYSYQLIATTSSMGQGGVFRSLGTGPSVNDWGEVAFTGSTDVGSGIYLGDTTGKKFHSVNPSFSQNPSRRFEDFVTVSNGDAISVQDRLSGSPPSTRIRIWDARPGVIDTWQTLDASNGGTTSAATVTFDPGFPGVPAAGIVGMMAAQPAGFNLTPGSSSSGGGYDAVVVPVMNDKGDVAWLGLSGSQWELASTSGSSADMYSGIIRQAITDDQHIIARKSGDAPSAGEPNWAADAPIAMWDTSYGSEQTIVCQSGCAHPGFTAIGRFAGASGDSAVIAFAATGPQGPGIYASVRAQLGGQSTPDGRVVVPVALTSSAPASGVVSAIEGGFKVAVNSTENSAERAVEIAFMADSASGDQGIWVSRLRWIGNADGTLNLANPTDLQADPPQMAVQQGATLPGLAGSINGVGYYDPLNNHNSGDLAFWVSMTTGAQAIVRARPVCGSTDYAAGTEVSSKYINQYDAGKTLDLPQAYSEEGGNACGPSSLSMLINNVQHARGVAKDGKMADLLSLYGDGTTSPDGTYNGVMERSDGQNIPIEDNVAAVYDRWRAHTILKSMSWKDSMFDNGQAGLDAELAKGNQVVMSTKFGTSAQAYGCNPAPCVGGGSTQIVSGGFGGGHMILFVGTTPMGDYMVEDPAGDFMYDPLHKTHYGAGQCGMYTVYPRSTVAKNLKPYGLSIGYKQTLADPDVLLIQAYPTGTTAGRTFTMVVTDPATGNQAGFPSGDANPVSAIPGSEAGIDPLDISAPDAPPEADIPDSSFPYAVMIPNPPANLQVQLQGQTTGATYRLQFTHFSGGTETSTAVLSDSIAAGQTKSVPVVQSPQATPQSVQAREGTPKTIQLAGTDPANRALTFAVATQPAQGTLSTVDASGKVVYTPNPGVTGTDIFTFTANNGVITSKPATVTITINSDAPPVANPGSATTDENKPVQISLSGTVPSVQPATYAVGQQPANGTVTISGTTVTYTPNQYFYGTDSFTFSVNDGYLTSAPASVAVTVNHVNQPPVVSVTAPSSVNEGAAPAAITASVFDPDGDPFTVQWATSLGTLAGNGTSATFSADDGPATATVTLTATNSHGQSTVATATITVNNVPPTVTAGPAQTVYWGLPAALSGSATDPSQADTAAGLNPKWNFGDATAAGSGYSVSHAYANPGSYMATLTATDKDGGVGRATEAVTVNKRGSSLAYTGSTAAGYGFVTLSARLSDSVDAGTARLAGHRVVFVVGSQAFAAVTDATGTATVTPAPMPPGSYSVAATFSADSLYLGSTARATLVVSNSAGSATGTALVPASGGTASFQVTSTGTAISGTLDYSNGSTVIHVTSFSPFGVRSDGHAAWFNGVDSTGRKITVYVEDNGSTATDVFKLTINGVAQTGSGALTGGTTAVVKS